MDRCFSIIFLLITILLFSGCETIQIQTRASRTAKDQDQLIAQENRQRIVGRLETLEMEINRTSREIDNLCDQFDNLRDRLNTRFANIEKKNEQQNQMMITQLSAEFEKLIKKSTPLKAAPATHGYEHIVQLGETLSAIAEAYKITSQAIIEANRIQNPNRLSVGQKLFIPE